MPSRAVASRLGVLLVVSVVAGVLMAGMLLPIVGGIGLVARAGANEFESLPSVLKQSPLPQASRILAADGSTIATFYYENRITVPLSHVPQVMQKALIAIEDVRFYEHHGVDIKATLRALLHNGSSGSVQQGGSTLTQQYVKNVLLESGDAKANQDTLSRKAQEAKYAIALEKRLSKRQILEDYFNIAYFGDGAYGIGAAASHYFSVDVRHLNLAQSALLAGIVKSPGAYDPVLHPVAAKDRRDTVLAQMLRYNFISQQDYDTAVAQPITLHLHRQGNGCEASRFPYFCDYVEHVIENSPAFGSSRPARMNLLRRGGLTITTTLDPKMQTAADKAVQKYVPGRDPSGIAAAEALVEPGTGKIRALSVSTPYGSDKAKGQTDIDYAVDQKYGGGATGFQAGSTFKLFVLAAALKQGIPLSTTIYSPQSTTVTGLTDCNGYRVAPWPVANAGDSERGTFNLVTGTWFSVNTFYGQLERRTGLCAPVKLAESMGVKQVDGSAPEQVGPFVLGAAKNGYSPLTVANAYATVAAHGQYCTPLAITKVVNRAGRVLAAPSPSCEQVLDPGLADTITSILRGVLTEPGATAAGVGPPGRPAAAKTGTAENNWASDFAGYVPQLAGAVWVGNPHHLQRLNNLTIGGRHYGEVYGATIAGPIWHDTMEGALEGIPVEPLARASRRFVRGLSSPVPDVTGLSVDDATNQLEQAGFTVTVAPGRVNSLLPKGTVAYVSPTSAPPGGDITIYVSNGVPPPTSPSPAPISSSPSATPSPTKHGHGHGH